MYLNSEYTDFDNRKQTSYRVIAVDRNVHVKFKHPMIRHVSNRFDRFPVNFLLDRARVFF